MAINEAELDFIDGVTLICGENGTSKSAIIDAIAICLTEYRRADTFLDYIQKGKTNAYIKLWAVYNGEELFFDMSINKEKGATFQRTITYQNKPYSMAQASDLINSLDLSYYSNIILSMQDAEDITKLSPAQRANYLQKLLNFDFSEYVKKIDDELNQLESQKTYNETQITFKKNEINTRQGEIKKPEELPYKKREYDSFVERKNKIIESINEQQQNIINMADQLKKKDELSMQRTKLELEINNIVEIEKKSKEHEEYIANLAEKYKHCGAELQAIEFELKQIRTKHDTDHKLYRTLDEEIKKLNEEIIKIIERLRITTKIRGIAEQGTCPECRQETKDIDVEQWKKKEESLTTEKYAAEKTREHLQKDYYEVQNEVSKSSPKILELEKRFSIKTEELKKIKLDQASAALLTIDGEKILQKAQFQELLADVRKQLSELETELTKEKNYSDVIKELRKEELEITTKISKYDEITKQNVFVGEHNINVEKAILKLKEEITALNAQLVISNKDVMLRKEAKIFIDKKLINYLIVKTCAVLESAMNDFVQVVFPKMMVKLYQSKAGVNFFYTTDRFKTGSDAKKDDLLNVKMASGFQKELLSIAFKVALCKAYNLSTLILDECDKAASDSASELLFETLLNENNFNQLLIITHKPSVKEMILAISPNYKIFTPNNGVFEEIT